MPIAREPRPYMQFNFLVQIDNRDVGGFQEITGIGTEVAVTEYRHGNDKENNVRKLTGLNKVAGKLFRIGHLGDLNEITLLAGIAGAEMAMRDVGIKVELGKGVAAAQQYWLETQKPLPAKNAAGPAEAAVAKKPAGVA